MWFKMENTGDERQESFVSSLDQFFTSIEPVLKEANSIEAAEDLLTNLETTDDNFHRFVVWQLYHYSSVNVYPGLIPDAIIFLSRARSRRV